SPGDPQGRLAPGATPDDRGGWAPRPRLSAPPMAPPRWPDGRRRRATVLPRTGRLARRACLQNPQKGGRARPPRGPLQVLRVTGSRPSPGARYCAAARLIRRAPLVCRGDQAGFGSCAGRPGCPDGSRRLAWDAPATPVRNPGRAKPAVTDRDRYGIKLTT